MANQLARIVRNSTVELECLAHFIRYMPAVNAPRPDDDEAARAIGRDGFDAFPCAGQQRAGGRPALVPEDKR